MSEQIRWIFEEARRGAIAEAVTSQGLRPEEFPVANRIGDECVAHLAIALPADRPVEEGHAYLDGIVEVLRRLCFAPPHPHEPRRLDIPEITRDDIARWGLPADLISPESFMTTVYAVRVRMCQLAEGLYGSIYFDDNDRLNRVMNAAVLIYGAEREARKQATREHGEEATLAFVRERLRELGTPDELLDGDVEITLGRRQG